MVVVIVNWWWVGNLVVLIGDRSGDGCCGRLFGGCGDCGWGGWVVISVVVMIRVGMIVVVVVGLVMVVVIG